MKRINYFLLNVACLLSGFTGFAQNIPCGTDQLYNEQVAANPEIAAQRAAFNKAFAEAMKHYNPADYKVQTGMGKALPAPKYIIPVVVHVFHQNGPENISEAQILNEIAQLNKSFRRQNSDTDNVRPIFKDIAADARIEFRLAKLDPQGNCTNGIVRYYAPTTGKGNDVLKKNSVWDTKRYFNIWVVNAINKGPGPNLAGYAQFPFATSNSLSSAATDGIMLIHNQVGNIGTATPDPTDNDNTENQTTATHEIGHWLGLFHPFQGDSCDSENDGISETPTTFFRPTVEEPLRNRCDVPNFNSCATDNPDLPDQYENFMDYFVGPCASNMFTLQQAARMYFCLENYRREIWQTENLIRTGVTDVFTCLTKPVASFNMSSPGKTACVGSNVTFRDNSYNAPVTSRLWEFGEGATPATATTPTATVSYGTPGWKTIKYTVTGANGSDEKIEEDYIYVQSQSTFYGEGDGFYNADWDYLNDFQQQGWYFDNEAEGNWVRTDKAQVNGNMSLMLPSKTLTYGFTYSLVSPTYNFEGAANPYISYNYSFAANYISTNTSDSRDMLQLFVSHNCGKNWDEVKKTAPPVNEPLTPNPLTTSGSPAQASLDYVPTNVSQWKNELVSGNDIGSGGLLASVKFKLSFTFQGGNNFYLDGVVVGVRSGINELTAKDVNFNVMPNPFNSSAKLTYELNRKQQVSIRIYDIVGKEIATLQDGSQAAGNHEEVINRDALGLKNGLYFIKTTIDGSSFSTKILIN
jgi:PKD repeat protein